MSHASAVSPRRDLATQCIAMIIPARVVRCDSWRQLTTPGETGQMRNRYRDWFVGDDAVTVTQQPPGSVTPTSAAEHAKRRHE